MPQTPPEPVEFEVIHPGGRHRERATGAAGGQDPLFALAAHVLDSLFTIPGTKVRFGLDPLLGLIPGLGDSSSTVLSVLLILRGARAGLPRVVLLRMAANVLINAGVGAIPVVGDAFSVWFKSNALNYALFEKHAGTARASTRVDWLFVGTLIFGVLLIAGLFVLGGLTLFAALWRLAWGGA